MKPMPDQTLERHRQIAAEIEMLGGDWSGTVNGVFAVKRQGALLWIISCDQDGWEHVSVSCRRPRRVPTWEEMCAVKDLFWDPEETVMQLHPPRSRWVSNHPNVIIRQCRAPHADEAPRRVAAAGAEDRARERSPRMTDPAALAQGGRDER